MSIGNFVVDLEGKEQDFTVEALAKELPQAWIREALVRTGRETRRRRRLPAVFMVWFMILMAFYRRVSYLNLLEKLWGSWWTDGNWEQDGPPCTSAVTKARDRLGLEPWRVLFERSACEWLGQTKGVYLAGRRLSAMDGVTLKTPDSPANRKHFGLPGASRGQSGYPQLRLVALLDVGTHLIQAFRHDRYRSAEIEMARDLVDGLGPTMAVLIDRNFVAYDFLWDVAQREAAFVARLKENIEPRLVRRLGEGDALVEVQIPRSYRRDRPDMPRTWLLRMITFVPDGGGETIRLLTNLLDPRACSKEAIASAYHGRWEEETAFDEIKTHLCECTTVNRPVIFRSRKPQRVHQELYALATAYNLLRKLMACSVKDRELSPRRVSFTSALERVREAACEMMRLPTERLPHRYAQLLCAIARTLNPDRPGRKNPRAVKVKMSKYPLKRKRAVA
jgi:hypothetical protein